MGLSRASAGFRRSGLIQGKDDRGKWTGLIGASCSACHDSRLGTTSESSFAWGLPNSANDFQKLGWKHTALTCSDSIFSNPFLPCREHMATIDSNAGHDFTQSLTDAERWAIIEYLKTL